jgi:hypothetical protein
MMSFEDNKKPVVNGFDELSADEKKDYYSKLRNEREKTTFSMMMRMNPEALTAIRKEFFIRKDAVKVDEENEVRVRIIPSEYA